MSLEPASVGDCDTPACDGEAATITPDGYVCETCAAEIATEYDRARERDTRGGER